MSLGTVLGLGPGHIVLDGESVLPPTEGAQQLPPPLFGPLRSWQGRPSQQLLSSCFCLSVGHAVSEIDELWQEISRGGFQKGTKFGSLIKEEALLHITTQTGEL